MAFTTLVLFQLCNVFNARSDEQSAFRGLFRNAWLAAALPAAAPAGLSLPFLQRAFQVVSLSPADWAFCALVASSVLWLRELSKLFRRALSRDASARREPGPTAGKVRA